MRGLTIIEVLVALVIFSVIAMGIGYAVVAGKSALFVSDIPTQLRQDLLFALMPMERELRQTAPSKINLTEGTVSNAVTFQIPHDDDVPADGIVVDDIGNIEWGQGITYALDGTGQLIRSQAGTTKVVAANIASLQFSRPAGQDAIIQIDITVQKADGQGVLHQDTEQAVVKMRN